MLSGTSFLLQHSRNKSTEYFLACGGINIIFNFLNQMKNFHYFELFSVQIDEQSVIRIFGDMFSAAMIDFDQYFIGHPRASDLMSFGYIMVDMFDVRTNISI